MKQKMTDPDVRFQEMIVLKNSTLR